VNSDLIGEQMGDRPLRSGFMWILEEGDGLLPAEKIVAAGHQRDSVIDNHSHLHLTDLSKDRGRFSAMYVCICNALNEERVKSASERCDKSVSNIFAELNVRPKCGKCLDHMRDFARAQKSSNPARETGRLG